MMLGERRGGVRAQHIPLSLIVLDSPPRAGA
jgi:hypothetical protein